MIIFYNKNIILGKIIEIFPIFPVFVHTNPISIEPRAIYLSTQRSVEVLLLLVSVHIWVGRAFIVSRIHKTRGDTPPPPIQFWFTNSIFRGANKTWKSKRIENIFAPKLSLKLNLFLLLFIPCNQTEISKSSKLVKEPSYFVHQNLDFTRVTSILSLLVSQSNPSSIFSNLSRKPINFLSI